MDDFEDAIAKYSAETSLGNGGKVQPIFNPQMFKNNLQIVQAMIKHLVVKLFKIYDALLYLPAMLTKLVRASSDHK